jgi:AsmA-like C-terminal region
VPLTASYRAVVDGTNGDTRLEEVRASFLKTSLHASGGVIDVKGVKGRRVTLDITIDDGRLEDVMRFAVKSATPPMTGALRLTTRFDLPPGDQDVVDKLRLNGRFTIDEGRFTDRAVQKQISDLSLRARGRAVPSENRSQVTSTFAGEFALGDGILALRPLTFNIPGAVVDVTGRYALRAETLAFEGDVVLEAKLSQTTDGFKSFLLKAIDPLFRREGRTVVPIRITGTRDRPSFGLNVKRVLKRGSLD